jgi:hypothetical protein
VEWSQSAEALTITPPVEHDVRNAVVFKVTLAGK